VVMLLEAGVDPSAKGKSSILSTKAESALCCAARGGCPETIAALVEAGAAVDCMTTCTPLRIAALRGHTQAVEVLLRAGANKGMKNRNWATALELCRTDTMREMLMRTASQYN